MTGSSGYIGSWIVQELWRRENTAGLAGSGPMNAAQRFQAELGYGLEGRKGRTLWVPFLGAESAAGASALRIGMNVSSGEHQKAGLEMGRRHNARGETGIAIQLQGMVRW